MRNFVFRNVIQARNLRTAEGARRFDLPIGLVILEDYIEGKPERTGLLASDRSTDVAEGCHFHSLVFLFNRIRRRPPDLIHFYDVADCHAERSKATTCRIEARVRVFLRPK